MASAWFNAGKAEIWTDDFTATDRIHLLLCMTDSELENGDANGPANLDVATINAFASATTTLAAMDEYDSGMATTTDIYPASAPAALADTTALDLGIALYDASARSTVPTITQDNTSDYGEFTGENYNFVGMANGTRAIKGIFLFIVPLPGTTAFSACVPLAWIDTGGFTVNPAGGDLQINWSSADGILFIS